LPFKENVFTTILSENLLHFLGDTGVLLKQLKALMSKNGPQLSETINISPEN